jgi:hypothetical protein
MSVVIRNLTPRPIFVPLNSGTNLRLSSGEVSDDVHDVELKNNAKVDKLLLQRAIAIESQAKDAAERKAARSAGEDETDARPPRARKVEPAG